MSAVDRNRTQRACNAAKANALKVEQGCLDCGEKHPAVLQFHHRDGRNGGRPIGHYFKSSMAAMMAEIVKCDVLCANCHLKRHYEEGSSFFAQRVA